MTEIVLPSLIWGKICGYFSVKQTLLDLIGQEHSLSLDPYEYETTEDPELINFIRENETTAEEINKREYVSLDCFLSGAKLIYNHDNFDQYVYHGRECLVTFDRLYQYKCYYIRLHDWDEGDEDDAFLTSWKEEDDDSRISFLLYFFDSFKVIHESQFKFQKLLSGKKKVEQTIEIFQKLSNKDEFLKYMEQNYSKNQFFE